MKRIMLYPWHGNHPDLAKRIEQCFPEGKWEDSYYVLPNPMTLDDFFSKWKSKFMVIPKTGNDVLICITQNASFSQR